MAGNNNVIAKLLHERLSLGNQVLEGWEAHKTGSQSYEIKRGDNSTIDVAIGDTIQGRGGEALKVVLDGNDNLSVGNYTVLTGRNILRGVSAKQMGLPENKQFLIKTDSGTERVRVGDTSDRFGKIDVDEFNNLSTDAGAIRIMPLVKEVNLVVLNEKQAGGNKAYFNVRNPNDQAFNYNGIPGVVHLPKEHGQPLRFSEKGEGDRLYTTAIFWKTNNDRFVNGQLRPLRLAVEEYQHQTTVKDLEAKAAKIDVAPDQLPGYTKALEARNEINTTSYETTLFQVIKGLDHIFPDQSIKQQHSQQLSQR